MITLTTDFGESAYVGAMRGSILRVNRDARVVDVTHAVPAHDVMQGALALYSVAPYFPKDVVHVCVVDPGVGTTRRPILVEAEGAAFVGPDNGVLIPAAVRLGLKRVRCLDQPKYWSRDVSPVFHGRDVFGPVAAHVTKGARFEDLGSVIDDHQRLDFGRPLELEDGAIEGTVLSIDAFGNVVTNVPDAMVRERFRVDENVRVLAGESRLGVPFRRTYGDVPAGEAVVLVGSSGFLELAMNRKRAAETFGLAAGDTIRIAPAG